MDRTQAHELITTFSRFLYQHSNAQMYISFFADRLNVEGGGSNHSLHLIASRLAADKNKVRIITCNFGGPNLVPEDVPYEVVPRPMGHQSRIVAAKEIYQLIEEEGKIADIIHIFDPSLVPLGGLYRYRGGDRPVVGRLNTYTMFCSNSDKMDDKCFQSCSIQSKFAHDDASFRSKLTSLPKYVFDTHTAPRLVNSVDTLFAISPAVKSVYESIGVNPDRVEIIPNFYDPKFSNNVSTQTDIHETASQSNPETDSPLDVIYVGRLYPKKGVDILLSGLNYLDKPVRLQIVGEGPTKKQLENRTDDISDCHNVEFLGWVSYDDLPAMYAQASIFVHPGKWPEPFGRTVLEAIQMNCLPIVSDIGAPPWIVDNKKLTFEPDNPKALAERINEVGFNPSVRERCLSSCIERLSTFSPDIVFKAIKDEYTDLV